MGRSLPLTYAAEELSDALTDRLTPVLAEVQLTGTQFNVLYMLVEDGPMRLSDLATQRRCVKSNISYITRLMLREGLIELSPSAQDGRARMISASKLGQRRYAAAKAAVQKIEDALRAKLGARTFSALERACLQAASELDAL